MLVFSNSVDEFKVDIISFAYSIFIHTIDNDLNVIKKELTKLIESLPVKD